MKDQHVNGWRLEQYRAVWRTCGDALETLQYEEHRDLAHLALIRRHPECFSGRTPTFEDFLASHIVALFRRR